MKNIIIVSGAALVYGNNAAAVRMNNYAKLLAENKSVNVYIYSQKNLYQDSEIRQVSERIFAPVDLGKENSSSIIEILNFVRLVKSKCATLDGEIIYLFYPSSNPMTELVLLFFYKIIGRAKVYCEINEVRKYAPDICTKSFIHKALGLFSCFIMENAARLYDGIICISKNIQKYYFNINDNSIVIPILSNIPSALDKKKDTGDIIKYVFTGSVSVEKENLVELLKGFSLLNKTNEKWVLHLYGKCSLKNKIKIEMLLEEYRLFAKVHLKGEIAHREISKVLLEADCLILPRRNTKQNYYGFSTKLSEYAVSGTPIILTNTGVVADYFTDGVNCLLTEGYEAENFHEKLLQFEAMSSSQKATIGKAALETAQSFFDWKKYSVLLNDFIK